MGINHVDYNIKVWKRKLCSTCEIFTDINHSYIPIGSIVKKVGFKSVIEYVKNLGDDYYNYLIDMIVFDAIVLNKGHSIPINDKLSELFLQLHISEKTGRGIPKLLVFMVKK